MPQVRLSHQENCAGRPQHVLLSKMPKIKKESKQAACKLSGLWQDPFEFSRALTAWQQRSGRHDLPWMVPDAYCRWLSEIMLQQTQVSVVIGYYERFLKRFPTVADLACAKESDVMSLWSGLGYYARARNLLKAAQMVMREFAGVFPTTASELQKLPGVGKSTAAAVASFCSGEPAAICDGNVKRVLSRVAAFDEPVDSAFGTKALWSLAQQLILAEAPGVFNQAMMDLGAMICTRTHPKCLLCPVSGFCRARALNAQETYPVKKPVREKEKRLLQLGLWVENDSVVLVERTAKDIWRGLWCLPQLRQCTQCKGLAPENLNAVSEGLIERFSHTLTHRELTIEIYRVNGVLENGQTIRRVPVKDVEKAPLPAPIKAFLLRQLQ